MVVVLCVLLRQEIAFGVQRRVASPEVLLLSLFLFYVLNKILRIGNAVQYEISPIVFSDNYIGFYVTYLKYYIKFQIIFPFSSIMLGVIILCDASGSGNTNYIAFAGIFGIISFIGAGINISRNCDECCRHGKGFLQ